MTWGSERARLSAGAGAFLAAIGLLLASPAQPEAASAGCGENSGSVCWEDESCVNILFYKQCTTDYKYYPRTTFGGRGGGGESEDGRGPLFEDFGGCTWGKDYLGWAPRGC